MSENSVKIDRDEAVRGLRLALEARGETYVYPRKDNMCNYVHNGVPDCLVAEALHQIGVPMETLDWMQVNLSEIGEYDGEEDRYIVAAAPSVDITPEAVEVFANAQSAQDVGTPWGEAVAEAV
jgi:hypothetical protein